MTIQYSLQLNNLTEEPNIFRARVSSGHRKTEKDMIAAIVGMGSSLTAVDVAGVLMAQKRFIHENLIEGNSVDLSIARFSLGIRGKFNGSSDFYDSLRHSIHVNANASAFLQKEIMTTAKPEKISGKKLVPNITAVKDITSGQVNGLVTPGGLAEIIGDGLKYEFDDPTQGLHFVASDDTETRVSFLAVNSLKKTIFLIPETLTPGTYYLAMKTGSDRDHLVGRSKFDLNVA